MSYDDDQTVDDIKATLRALFNACNELPHDEHGDMLADVQRDLARAYRTLHDYQSRHRHPSTYRTPVETYSYGRPSLVIVRGDDDLRVTP